MLTGRLKGLTVGETIQFTFEPAAVDEVFRDGDEIKLGNIAILALHTPGHTKGSTTYVMKIVVIAVGAYVRPLLKQAKAAAKIVGAVAVDVGDTACKVPLASAYIAKVEAAGRVGKKRKTIKC